MTLTILEDAPYSLKEQREYVDRAVNYILSGDCDILATDFQIKAAIDTLEAIRGNEDVKRATIEEASLHGKTFDLYNCKITISSRTTKDYSGCGDSVYNELMIQLEALKRQIKARCMMLDNGVNPETGETFNPPKTSTSEFLTYKFK